MVIHLRDSLSLVFSALVFLVSYFATFVISTDTTHSTKVRLRFWL